MDTNNKCSDESHAWTLMKRCLFPRCSTAWRGRNAVLQLQVKSPLRDRPDLLRGRASCGCTAPAGTLGQGRRAASGDLAKILILLIKIVIFQITSVEAERSAGHGCKYHLTARWHHLHQDETNTFSDQARFLHGVWWALVKTWISRKKYKEWLRNKTPVIFRMHHIMLKCSKDLTFLQCVNYFIKLMVKAIHWPKPLLLVNVEPYHWGKLNG